MQIKSLEDLHREKAAGLARLYPSSTQNPGGHGHVRAGGRSADGFSTCCSTRPMPVHWDGTVEKTGCIGFCYKEPLVDVIIPGQAPVDL